MNAKSLVLLLALALLLLGCAEEPDVEATVVAALAATRTAAPTVTATAAGRPIAANSVPYLVRQEDNAYVITLSLPADLDPALKQQFTTAVETSRLLP